MPNARSPTTPLPASVTLDSTPTLTLKLNVPSAFRPTTAQLVKSARPTSASALAAWIQSVLIQSPVKMVSAHHFLATMSLVEQMPNVPLPITLLPASVTLDSILTPMLLPGALLAQRTPTALMDKPAPTTNAAARQTRTAQTLRHVPTGRAKKSPAIIHHVGQMPNVLYPIMQQPANVILTTIPTQMQLQVVRCAHKIHTAQMDRHVPTTNAAALETLTAWEHSHVQTESAWILLVT